jgi:hypothetical protein
VRESAAEGKLTSLSCQKIYFATLPCFTFAYKFFEKYADNKGNVVTISFMQTDLQYITHHGG